MSSGGRKTLYTQNSMTDFYFNSMADSAEVRQHVLKYFITFDSNTYANDFSIKMSEKFWWNKHLISNPSLEKETHVG